MSAVLTFCLHAALLTANAAAVAQTQAPGSTNPSLESGVATSAPDTRMPPSVPAAAEPQPLFASGTRLDRIGRVVAPVMINGQGPFRLVVDTGASHSTFSPQLVAALGLTPSLGASLQLNGVTGVAEVPTVSVQRLQAGDMVVKDAQVPVVWSSIMAGADGILGVAGLRSHRILVDFREDRIVITRSSRSTDTQGYLRIPARLVPGGLLVVDATIGGVPVRAVIDTGAERTLGNAALRDALRAKRRSHKTTWSSTDVYGATTEVAAGEVAIAPPIKLGPAVVRGTEVVYGDFHIFKVWKLEARPAALIGMDVLGTVGALIVDYSRRELYLDIRPARMPSVARGDAQPAR